MSMPDTSGARRYTGKVKGEINPDTKLAAKMVERMVSRHLDRVQKKVDKKGQDAKFTRKEKFAICFFKKCGIETVKRTRWGTVVFRTTFPCSIYMIGSSVQVCEYKKTKNGVPCA